MAKTKRKNSRLSGAKAAKRSPKSAGWGGSRAHAGRKPKPFSEAADVLLESDRLGSRKAGLIEVANRRYKSVVEKKGLDKAVDRARKGFEDKIPALKAAIEATPEIPWPTPAFEGDGMLGDDADDDSGS